MRKICFFLASLFLMNGGTLCAQSLKQQNKTLKNQNIVLTDSIKRLVQKLDSVSQLHKKAADDYRTLQTKFRTFGSQSDSLLQLNRMQASEIYALQVTNDTLNRRLENLLAEKNRLTYNLDSLVALQEKRTETKKQKDLWDRKGWRNISYSLQQINSDLYRSTLKPDYAFGFTIGQTFYLHKKPLANMIRFGLDWSYFDLNIAKYSAPYSDRIDENVVPDNGNVNGGTVFQNGGYGDDFDNPFEDFLPSDDEENSSSQYKMEAAMLFGPSITINPVDKLMIQAYFRYAPTYSMLLDEDLNYYGSYASFFNAGVALSYKMIGLGVESRWGTSTYSQEVYNEQIDDYEYRDMKWRTKGVRLYLSFRF